MDVLSDAVNAMRTGRPHSARVRQPAAFSHRLAAVDGAGFHAVLQGACWLIPPDGPPIALRAGDIAFLPSGCAHGLADRRPGDGAPPVPVDSDRSHGCDTATVLLCGAYLLDRSQPYPLLGDLPAIVHLRAGGGRYSALRAAVDLLADELAAPGAGSRAVVSSLLDTLLLYLLRAYITDQVGQVAVGGWSTARYDPQIAAALRAIHNDPGRRWTVEELGQQAGLSRAAFARRFTGVVGQPPLTYLTRWRMTTAAGLLLRSDAPLSAVARRIGYASQFAFAHAFKRVYGVAPGAYRRRWPSSAVAAPQ